MPPWLILGLLAAGALVLSGSKKVEQPPPPGGMQTNMLPPPDPYKTGYDAGYQTGVLGGSALTSVASSPAAMLSSDPTKYAEGYAKGFEDGAKKRAADMPPPPPPAVAEYPTGAFDTKMGLVEQLVANSSEFWTTIEKNTGAADKVANSAVEALVNKHTFAMRVLLNAQQKAFAEQSRISNVAWLLLATQAPVESGVKPVVASKSGVLGRGDLGVGKDSSGSADAARLAAMSAPLSGDIVTDKLIKQYLQDNAPTFVEGIWDAIAVAISKLDSAGCPFALWNGQPSLRAYYYGDDATPSTCKPLGLCSMPNAIDPYGFRPDSVAEFEANRKSGAPSSGYYMTLFKVTASSTTFDVRRDFVRDNLLAALTLLKRYTIYNPFVSAAYATQALYSFNWMAYAPRSNTGDLDTFTKNAKEGAKSELVGTQIRAFYETLIAGVATSLGNDKKVPANRWKELVSAAWDGWNEGIGLRIKSVNVGYDSVVVPGAIEPDYGVFGLAFAYKYALDAAERIVTV